jgi:hypothetical protein
MTAVSEDTQQTECLKIRHLFWEFYAQWELWFLVGSGLELCGYNLTRVYPQRLVEKVDTRFEKTVDDFFALLQFHLEHSIRSEMMYVFSSSSSLNFFHDAVDSTKFEKRTDRNDGLAVRRASKALTAYLKSHDNSITRRISPEEAPIKWAKIAFDWEGWNYSYCGPLWARACEVFLDTPKRKTTHSRVSWIDNCLDMVHNNGFLMNKTECAALERFDLNTRASFRSWRDLIRNNIYNDFLVRIEGLDNPIPIYQELYPLSTLTKNLLLKYTP